MTRWAPCQRAPVIAAEDATHRNAHLRGPRRFHRRDRLGDALVRPIGQEGLERPHVSGPGPRRRSGLPAAEDPLRLRFHHSLGDVGRRCGRPVGLVRGRWPCLLIRRLVRVQWSVSPRAGIGLGAPGSVASPAEAARPRPVVAAELPLWVEDGGGRCGGEEAAASVSAEGAAGRTASHARAPPPPAGPRPVGLDPPARDVPAGWRG
jgi:hypothetical protein